MSAADAMGDLARVLAKRAGCPGESCPQCLGTGQVIDPRGWHSCPGPLVFDDRDPALGEGRALADGDRPFVARGEPRRAVVG